MHVLKPGRQPKILSENVNDKNPRAITYIQLIEEDCAPQKQQQDSHFTLKRIGPSSVGTQQYPKFPSMNHDANMN